VTIRASTLGSGIALTGDSAPAVGGDARRIDEHIDAIRHDRVESGTRAVARGELLEAFHDAASDEWDGPGTNAMSVSAYLRAEDFLAALPHGFESPSIATAPDGSVAMEWSGPDRRSFSIQIDAAGDLSIAWVWGQERGHAWTRMDDGIPDEILSRLRKTLT
jgi:hypothetical protein